MDTERTEKQTCIEDVHLTLLPCGCDPTNAFNPQAGCSTANPAHCLQQATRGPEFPTLYTVHRHDWQPLDAPHIAASHA